MSWQASQRKKDAAVAGYTPRMTVEMGWSARVRCACPVARVADYQIISRAGGYDRPWREVGARMRCSRCGRRPTGIELTFGYSAVSVIGVATT